MYEHEAWPIHLKVVSLNPALKLSKEKQALRLIKEYKEIRDMENDMEKVRKLEMWRNSAVALASETSSN